MSHTAVRPFAPPRSHTAANNAHRRFAENRDDHSPVRGPPASLHRAARGQGAQRTHLRRARRDARQGRGLDRRRVLRPGPSASPAHAYEEKELRADACDCRRSRRRRSSSSSRTRSTCPATTCSRSSARTGGRSAGLGPSRRRTRSSTGSSRCGLPFVPGRAGQLRRAMLSVGRDGVRPGDQGPFPSRLVMAARQTYRLLLHRRSSTKRYVVVSQ